MHPPLPRGIRNNNPGNLNFVGQKGARKESGPNSRFAVFPTPQDGLRALRDQLIRYHQRGITTVAGIIARWAPPSDSNDTSAYTRSVAARLGVAPTAPLEPLTPDIMEALMHAIITVENGQDPYGPMVRTMAHESTAPLT